LECVLDSGKSAFEFDRGQTPKKANAAHSREERRPLAAAHDRSRDGVQTQITLMTKRTNTPSYSEATPTHNTASMTLAFSPKLVPASGGERERLLRCLERWENEGGTWLKLFNEYNR